MESTGSGEPEWLNHVYAKTSLTQSLLYEGAPQVSSVAESALECFLDPMWIMRDSTITVLGITHSSPTQYRREIHTSIHMPAAIQQSIMRTKPNNGRVSPLAHGFINIFAKDKYYMMPLEARRSVRKGETLSQ